MDPFISEYKYSEIQEEFPDKEKYPLYYQASKHEFTINAGEKLFIPAGWFHFVFSEDADPETGLNFAVNFWYHPENNWQPGQPSRLLPRVEKHNLCDINPREFYGNKNIKCYRSELAGLFPSNRVFHKFPGKVWNEYMTFDEFYQTKNPKYYIVQDDVQIPQFAPKYTTKLMQTSTWINFGNVRSLMHFDENDNWLCQLQGKKRVLLFPHEERYMLYMFNPLNINAINTCISCNNSVYIYVVRKNIKNIENFDISELYNTEINEYIKNLDVVPKFEFPIKFKTHDTKGIHYEEPQKHCLTSLFVLDGRGVIYFKDRGGLRMDKGDIFIFPNNFSYTWQVRGNLKLVVPI